MPINSEARKQWEPLKFNRRTLVSREGQRSFFFYADLPIKMYRVTWTDKDGKKRSRWDGAKDGIFMSVDYQRMDDPVMEQFSIPTNSKDLCSWLNEHFS